ncbi:MAG: hypothetical protein J6A47_05040, partial [Bacilli bacterium]|nr:hypothetical protein [Bacilli bacterium]
MHFKAFFDNYFLWKIIFLKRSIYKEGELDPKRVVAKYTTTVSDGKAYDVTFYNLDVVIELFVNIQQKCHIGSFSENVTFCLASDHGFSSFHGRKSSFSLADSKEERF